MKIGFIGTGNMGAALAKGYLAARPEERENVLAYDADAGKLAGFAAETGVRPCGSIGELAAASQAVVLAVKPGAVPAVLAALKEAAGEAFAAGGKTLMSIAAGVKVEALEGAFEGKAPVVRVMPNTPALVGEGMSVLCRNSYVSEAAFEQARQLFSSVGRVEEVEEKLMDAVTGLSGSGPAYVYIFIEALADGGVARGLPRDKAYLLAAQTVLGSAKMVLETGIHPGELKDRVCSPGGTTIEGVAALEERGFRSAAAAAVEASAEKSASMGK